MTTHGPIDPQYLREMTAVAKVLDDTFNGEPPRRGPRKIAFALLLFPFGEELDGRVNYISNAQRSEMIVALRELLERFEGTHPDEQA